jgi:hypothetical protein
VLCQFYEPATVDTCYVWLMCRSIANGCVLLTWGFACCVIAGFTEIGLDKLIILCVSLGSKFRT